MITRAADDGARALRYRQAMPRRLLRAHGELLLVFGLGLLAQLELWVAQEWRDDRRKLAPVELAMTAVLLLRLRAPLVTLVLQVALFQVLHVVNSVADDDPITAVILAQVAIYSAGAHARGRALAAAAVVVAAVTVATTAQDENSLNLGGFLFFSFFLVGPFVAGIVIRMRREREGALRRERDERARAAVAEERTRIARELHDVVSHAISVIVLQARGARHALVTDPDDAREAIDAIESTAQHALTEMRRLLGVLRQSDEELSLAPQPRVSELPALAAHVREAGLPVELAVEGAPVDLPPGVDLSAYRIVQEALTNALKHAGPASARVTVRYEPEALLVEVTDDGAGARNGDGAGHGLVGMRERVAVFGGDLDAGGRPDGGYVVRARLPL